MGAIQSSVSRTTINSLNSNINSEVISVLTEAKAFSGVTSLTSINTSSCPPYAPFQDKGSFSVTITDTSVSNLDSSQVSQSQAKLIASLKTAIAQTFQQESSNIAQWLATASTIQTNINTDQIDIQNKMDNHLSSYTNSECFDVSKINSKSALRLCGSYSSISIVQTSIANAIANCLQESVIDAFLQSTSAQNISDQVEQKLAAQEAGASSLFAGLGVMVIIIAVIIVLVIYSVLKNPNTTASLKKAATLAVV